jgi:hypothetical protein
MSPIRKPPPFSGRTLVIAGVAILAGVVLLWVASAALTARHNRQVGDGASGGVVELGNASRLAAQFERGDRVPMYFPDVSGNARRAVYLVHEGRRASKGWTAFLAQVPGEDDSCQWEWNTRTARLDASCDPQRHAGADGGGLQQFPVGVQDGKLRLDLRGEPTAGPPTTGPHR